MIKNNQDEDKRREVLKFVMKNLFESMTSGWLNDVEEEYVSNRGILTILNKYHEQRYALPTRFLNLFVDVLSVKMFLSLAWCWIPKGRQPFVPYVKYEVEANEYSFLIDKFKAQMKIGGNDVRHVKRLIIDSIKKNTAAWFIYYGIDKETWKKFKLDFNIVTGGKEIKVQVAIPKGLAAWGMV